MRIWWLVILLAFAAVDATAACKIERVSLRGSWGNTEFTVDIADTNASRNQGLMFRKSMPRFSGMLFVYERPQKASFWMRNTLIPLDMIFIGKDGIVRKIHHNAIPKDETPISGGKGVLLVLEINGGLAKTLGINKGSEIQHPSLGPEAVWPCT